MATLRIVSLLGFMIASGGALYNYFLAVSYSQIASNIEAIEIDIDSAKREIATFRCENSDQEEFANRASRLKNLAERNVVLLVGMQEAFVATLESAYRTFVRQLILWLCASVVFFIFLVSSFGGALKIHKNHK